MSCPKAVFLDIDNTILNFDAYVRETMRQGFTELGICTFEEEMYDVFTRENHKLWQRIEQGTLTFEELQKVRWNIIFEALGLSYDGPTFERYFRAALNRSAIPEEGAEALVRFLSSRSILCSASNGPHVQQTGRLAIAGLEPLFRYHFTSERLGVSKPAQAFFDAAFRELNEGRSEPIRPEECLMIGDSMTSDMAGGIGAGMRTLWYCRGSLPAELPLKPDYIVTELAQIPELPGLWD